MNVLGIYKSFNRAKAASFYGYKSAVGKKFDVIIKKGSASESESDYIINALNKILKKRIAANETVGEGCTGVVYKIDNKYVLKAPLGSDSIPENSLNVVNQNFQQLKRYYGEPVIKIGDFSVLKNASKSKEQITAGVAKSSAKSLQNPMSDVEYYNSVIMPKIARAPQRSYDNLAKDIATLNSLAKPEQNIFYHYDYNNPNNIILNGKTFNMIDEMNVSQIPTQNTLSDLINIFLKQMKVNSPAVPSVKIQGLRQTIAQKIIKAGMKNDLPLANREKADGGWTFVFKYLCRAKEEPQKIMDKLREISKISDKAQQERELENYLSTIF